MLLVSPVPPVPEYRVPEGSALEEWEEKPEKEDGEEGEREQTTRLESPRITVGTESGITGLCRPPQHQRPLSSLCPHGVPCAVTPSLSQALDRPWLPLTNSSRQTLGPRLGNPLPLPAGPGQSLPSSQASAERPRSPGSLCRRPRPPRGLPERHCPPVNGMQTRPTRLPTGPGDHRPKCAFHLATSGSRNAHAGRPPGHPGGFPGFPEEEDRKSVV